MLVNAIENLTRCRFFALSWTASQAVPSAFKYQLLETWQKEQKKLLVSLPERFHPTIRDTLASLPNIVSNPVVLVHRGLSEFNIMVDEKTCHMVGVIGWAEAEMGTFGTNLHWLQNLMSKVHLKDGRIRFEDYDDLERASGRP